MSNPGNSTDSSATTDIKAAPEGMPSSPAAPPADQENLGSKSAGEGEGGVRMDSEPSPKDSPEAKTPVAPPPPPKDETRAPQWKAEKYDKVLAQKRELEEELARLRAAQDPNAPKLTPDDVNRRAQEIAQVNEFNRRANETAEAGKKQFPDFLAKMSTLREQVDQNDEGEKARFVNMVAAVMEAGEEAPRILYELGSNPDLATEMLKASPTKQGMKIAELAAKKGEPEPSGAPRPGSVIVGGRGESHEPIEAEDATRGDKLSTRTWMERRQAHIEKLKKDGVRIW